MSTNQAALWLAAKDGRLQRRPLRGQTRQPKPDAAKAPPAPSTTPDETLAALWRKYLGIDPPRVPDLRDAILLFAHAAYLRDTQALPEVSFVLRKVAEKHRANLSHMVWWAIDQAETNAMSNPMVTLLALGEAAAHADYQPADTPEDYILHQPKPEKRPRRRLKDDPPNSAA